MGIKLSEISVAKKQVIADAGVNCQNGRTYCPRSSTTVIINAATLITIHTDNSLPKETRQDIRWTPDISRYLGTVNWSPSG